MQNYMMNVPLLLSSVIDYASRTYPDIEVVARENDGTIVRSTYAKSHSRIQRVAKAFSRLGIERGDRIGAVAWSTLRYWELFYAVTGIGATLHTINPRLFEDDLVHIINHAEDKWLCLDRLTYDLVKGIAHRLTSVEKYLWLDDRTALPEGDHFCELICFDTLMQAEVDDFKWPEFDENTASTLCYTSGTTSRPKGAFSSHRSSILIAMTAFVQGLYGLKRRGHRDLSLFSLTGMFHANGWHIPYVAPLAGARMVLSGRETTPDKLHELIVAGEVTMASGVPTIFQSLVDYVRKEGKNFHSLERVTIGGSGPSGRLIRTLEEDYGIEVGHSWGMTECQLGAGGIVTPQYDRLSADERVDVQSRGGLIHFGLQSRLVDDGGRELPSDGQACGHLQVRSPWVIHEYLGHEGTLTSDGWFPTGDIARIYRDGRLQLVDRSKDVIKSGGEWISSIQIESLVNLLEGVAESAVIGIAHVKWQERPLLVVVRSPGSLVDETHVREWLAGKIAKWWMPDEVVFLDRLPHTATGKIDKKLLRQQVDKIR